MATMLDGCDALNISNAMQRSWGNVFFFFEEWCAYHGCHQCECIADGRSKKRDDARHRQKHMRFLGHVIRDAKLENVLCHWKNRRKEKQRKTESAMHGYYYYRWHRLISCRFNHHVIKLEYDIRSVFRCNTTWERFQKEYLRMLWVDQRPRSS